MTFQIDISPSAITHPGRLDLATIEAAMLWPDDEEHRIKFWKAAVATSFLELAERNEDGPLLMEIKKAKDSLPDLASLQPTDKRFAHGIIAGKRVLEVVLSAHYADRKLRLSEIDDRIAKELKRVYQIEPKTILGPVMKFRPVAHLWAARLVAAHEGKSEMPCQVAELPRFLGTAEAIRALAETTRLANHNNMVMRPGEAVTLPAEVRALLPKVEIVAQ